MTRLIWFLLKIALIAVPAVWLATQQGTVQVNWNGDIHTLDARFVLFGLFALAFTIIGVTRLIDYFVHLPSQYRDRKKLGDAEKGLEALTLGLSAAAAGDSGYTKYYAERASKLLPGTKPHPISTLLRAQALNSEGDYDEAQKELKTLLHSSEGSLLGLKGLVRGSLAHDDPARALAFARQTFEIYKGRDKAWLLKTTYELELANENWEAAFALLPKLKKAGILSKESVQSESAALWTAMALHYTSLGAVEDAAKAYQKALKYEPGFLPAALSYATHLVDQGRTRKAIHLIQTCWRTSPHPQLSSLWKRINSERKKPKPDAQWSARLIAINPEHLESLLLQAELAMNQKDFTAARAALHSAEVDYPVRRVYALWSKLDELSDKSDATVRHRLSQRADALPDPIWTCPKTGETYADWQPLSGNKQFFNTLLWISPAAIVAPAHGSGGGLHGEEILKIA